MRALLDTHALLWWWEDSPRLSARIRQELESSGNDIFVSPVSLWEIATKVGIGKLHPRIPVADMASSVTAEAFIPLPLDLAHGVRAGSYDATLHRDPFDRMLAAQAELEGLTLLTCDKAFRDFPCATLWD